MVKKSLSLPPANLQESATIWYSSYAALEEKSDLIKPVITYNAMDENLIDYTVLLEIFIAWLIDWFDRSDTSIEQSIDKFP